MFKVVQVRLEWVVVNFKEVLDVSVKIKIHSLCLKNLFFGRDHCVKNVRIRSYSGPYFPTFGLNTKRYFVSLRIFTPNAGKYGPE